MKILSKIEKYFLLIIFLTVCLVILYSNKLILQTDDSQKLGDNHLDVYSKWPQFNIDSDSSSLECFNKRNLSMKLLAKIYFKNDKRDCSNLLDKIRTIYDIKIKSSKIDLPESFKPKVKEWLGNNEELFKEINNQELYLIYNKFTHEENIYNLLRGKRPVKQSDINPDLFYNKTLMDSITSCDFCNYKNNTAINEYGPLETNHSILVSNVFSFHKYHAMFLPKKHDLLKISLSELKDTFNVAIEWFERVHNANHEYRFPSIFWDFLPKSGASQVHPHLHGTIDNNRYFGLYETIRSSAEKYFIKTKNNYFTDFASIHSELGLTIKHKDSLLIIPLTPKKDYDVTILSENLNESTVELIYGVLMSLIKELKIYPFSLIIYLPEMDDNSLGRTPLYVKILPRGDISAIRAQFSSLELLSVFNVNLDQFKVIEFYRKSLRKFIDIY